MLPLFSFGGNMLVFNKSCGGGSLNVDDFENISDYILTGIAYSTNYELSVLIDEDGNVLVTDFI